MKIRIKGQELPCNGMQIRGNDTAWGGRESRALTLSITYEEAMALFGESVPWAVVYEGEDEAGIPYAKEYNMSEFSLAGPISDNRNGTVTIKMGKNLPVELLEMTLHTVPESRLAAAGLRSIIEEAVQSIEDDQVALAAVTLYPTWGALLAGTKLEAGMRIQHNGELYRVLQTHTVSADWEPGVGTESLYARIDEVHSGSEDDPIPYDGNMALSSGLHYSQGGVVYLCVRDTVNPVYHSLADLVGLYVEVVA